MKRKATPQEYRRFATQYETRSDSTEVLLMADTHDLPSPKTVRSRTDVAPHRRVTG